MVLARSGWTRLGAGILLATAVIGCGGTPAASNAPAAAVSSAPSFAAPASIAPVPPAIATAASSAGSPASTEPVSSPPVIASASRKPRPSIDTAALAAYLDASIELLNAGDADLVASVSFVDPKAGDTALGTYAVAPSEERKELVPAGTYQLVFSEGAAATPAGSCTIVVADHDAYTFVAAPGAMMVSRAGSTPAAARDLFVATSSLCQG